MTHSGDGASVTRVTSLAQLLSLTGGANDSAKAAAAHVTEVEVTGAGPELRQLPPLLCTVLSHITRLNLEGAALAQLLPDIANLRQLQALSVARNALTALPPGIGHLASLTDLDASWNALTALPPQLCQLAALKYLNVMGNQLSSLPDEFGALGSLVRLGLKTNRLTCLPDSFTRLSALVELFVTDNALEALPRGFGAGLTSLVKMQASFNRLAALPEDMAALPCLEMLRVAVCALPAAPFALPSSSSSCCFPRLAWFSLGGNQACGAAAAALRRSPSVAALAQMPPELAQLGVKLGSGASGIVFLGAMAMACAPSHAPLQPVAVKLFKSGSTSPDGQVADEVAIACAVEHPHLTRVRAVVASPPAMIMDLVPGAPLAAKPTSQHLLRCKWDQDGTRFPPAALLAVAAAVASALAHLHEELCCCHGDVYAHNILVDLQAAVAGSSAVSTTLCDFGAAFCYDAAQRPFWQAMEVRAYGLLLQDLLQHRLAADACPAAVLKQAKELALSCVQPDMQKRPSFASILAQLQGMSKQLAAGNA